jgi:hypothetical protein
MRREVVALFIVATVSIAACSGATSTVPPPSTTAPSLAATTTTTAIASAMDDTAGATLCTALRALQAAQNDHAAPMAALMADWMSSLGREPPAGQRAQALGHGSAIAEVVTTYGPTLINLRSTQFGDLIVDARDAYAGYGQGITALRPAFDAKVDVDFASIALDAFTAMRTGKESLDLSIDVLDRLDASGALICPE